MALVRPGRNFTINVSGALVTMAVGVAVVPNYIRAVGVERYGMLALIWVTFGFLGFMDLGMSRASTNALARVGQKDFRQIGEIFGTALFSSLVLGCVGGVTICLLADWYMGTVHMLSDVVRAEVKSTLWCVSIMFPLTLSAGVAIGAIDAHERFLISNLAQASSTVLMQILPLATAILVTPKLTIVLPVLLATRLITAIATIGYCIIDQGGPGFLRVSRTRMKELFSFGGWLTVTNIISPIMISIDQFLVTSWLGAKFMTYYSVPFNVAYRMQFFSGTMARTFFPAFSRMGREDALAILSKATLSLSFLSVLIYAPILLASELVFRLWLGPNLAVHVLPVARLLLVGAWINGLAVMPFGFCQGQGRPDLVAKVHLCEIVPYLACLLFLMKEFGIVGAAMAWNIRVTADLFILWWVAKIPVRRFWDVLPNAIIVFVSFLGALTLQHMLLLQASAALSISAVILWLWHRSDPTFARTVMRILIKLHVLRQMSSRESPSESGH